MAETNNSQSNPEPPLMYRLLLKACCKNDLDLLSQLILDHGTNILFSVTPQGNNCLHLAAMLGLDNFARDIWSRSPSLFFHTNKDGETPLIVALMAANAKLASDMLTAASQLLLPDIEGRNPLNEMLLKIDKRGDNALHHAIRNGFEDFAIDLLNIEPHLSQLIDLRQLENLETDLSWDRESQQLEEQRQELKYKESWQLPEDSKQKLSKGKELQLPPQTLTRIVTVTRTVSQASTVMATQPLLEDGQPQLSENLEKEQFKDREPRMSEGLKQNLSEHEELQLQPPLPQLHVSPLPQLHVSPFSMIVTRPLVPPPLSEDEDLSYPMSESTKTRQAPFQQQFPLLKQQIRPQALMTTMPPTPPPLSEDENSSHPMLESTEWRAPWYGLKISESPMFMAARKGYSRLVERLLEIPSSVEYGPGGYSALEAAADNPGIYEMILKKRPKLSHRITGEGLTPLTACISEFKTAKILLEDDPFQAYVKNFSEAFGGLTPFLVAAQLGLVSIAKEIIDVCPDSAYITEDKSMANALHIAIRYEQESFVDFILKTPQLHRLINQADYEGHLPLHIAAKMCNPQILHSLTLHKGQDCTAINAECRSAVDIVCERKSLWKTLKWNESFTLLSNAIPNGWRNTIIYVTKGRIKQQAIKEVKSLTERDTNNTSLIATLLATMTFAAAFTVPGGLSSDPSDTGLPVFARKAVFQVFLISDTIAMCSSLAVAFLCVLATWEDLDYLLNYRKTTRPLMWCAYIATAIAFGTGVFTMTAPKRLWLAILVLVMCGTLPFLSKIIGDWPKIRLRLKFGRQFRSDLLPNL